MIDIAADAVAIANLKARYCAAADLSATDAGAARAAFATVFTDDFVGDYGMEPMHGPQQITDFLCSAIGANSQWMVHMLHSPCIAISGDAATGDWTVMVHSRRRVAGELMVVLGRYSDEFRRDGNDWRISRVTFTRPE